MAHGKFKMRGSSAIFDACASVFILTGATNEPTRVEHEKDRHTGRTVDGFYFRVDDTEVDGVPKAGLQLVHLEREQIEKSGTSPHAALKQRILDYLGASDGLFCGPRSALIKTLEINSQNGYAALGELESLETIVVEGGRGDTRIRLKDVLPTSHP